MCQALRDLMKDEIDKEVAERVDKEVAERVDKEVAERVDKEVAERVDKEVAERIEQEGKHVVLNNIRNLMKTMNLTAEAVMQALELSDEEQAYYKALL